MKTLIWIAGIFGLSLIVTVLKEGSGITLGAIPTIILYGGMFWLIGTLCKKWDEHKKEKAENQEFIAKISVPDEEGGFDPVKADSSCKSIGTTEFSLSALDEKPSMQNPHLIYGFDVALEEPGEQANDSPSSSSDKPLISYDDNVAAADIPQIKFCRACGTKLLDGSQFCHKCGTKAML